MNLILGMIVRDEEKMLRLTLKTQYQCVSQKVALDTGSTDGTVELLKENGWVVYSEPWSNHYAAARNKLMMTVREYHSEEDDWIMMLDADEVMHPSDMHALKSVCETTEKPLVSLPRINLIGKGEWRDVGSYPDAQARCVKIWGPIQFRNAVHEEAFRRGSKRNASADGMIEFARGLHLWHYGWTKTPQEIYMRSENYLRISAGMPPITEVPKHIKDITFDQFLESMRKEHNIQPFEKSHPLKGLL